VTRQKVLLLGSSGFLGRALYQEFSNSFDIVPTHTTNKVFEASEPYDFFSDDVQIFLDKHSPDLVVMAAAVEKDAGENYRARVQDFVMACHSKYLVYISSDALFDGTKGNYSETDPPSPITPYGRNLAHFEKQIQSHVPNHLIIRPSYLYGYSVGVLDSRLENAGQHLNAGETLSYFDDMYKSPLEVGQAAKFIACLVAQKYQGTVHVAGERKSVYKFYLESLQSLGVDTSKLKVSKMPTASAWPRDTSLDISLLTKLRGTKH
jgi:dTDP-4-dehydrorhamnose reductase